MRKTKIPSEGGRQSYFGFLFNRNIDRAKVKINLKIINFLFLFVFFVCMSGYQSYAAENYFGPDVKKQDVQNKDVLIYSFIFKGFDLDEIDQEKLESLTYEMMQKEFSKTEWFHIYSETSPQKPDADASNVLNLIITVTKGHEPALASASLVLKTGNPSSIINRSYQSVPFSFSGGAGKFEEVLIDSIRLQTINLAKIIQWTAIVEGRPGENREKPLFNDIVIGTEENPVPQESLDWYEEQKEKGLLTEGGTELPQPDNK